MVEHVLPESWSKKKKERFEREFADKMLDELEPIRWLEKIKDKDEKEKENGHN